MYVALLTLVAPVLAGPAYAPTGQVYAPPGQAYVPTGQVYVVNGAGGALDINLSGVPAVAVPNGDAVLLTVPVGQAMLHASYMQYGQKRSFFSTEVPVTANRTTSVVLPRETVGRVMVQNDTRLAGVVVSAGQELAQLAPGEQEVVTVPLGTVDLALVAGGKVVDDVRVTVRPFAEHFWVAEGPPIADITVLNPLPIPVELVCDKGLVRTVQPHMSTVYQGVPVGTFHLTARRITDEYIDDQHIVVAAGKPNLWQVDPPGSGLVQINSDHYQETKIYLDGKSFATLAPDVDKRVSVPVGWHRLVARDSKGRVLLDRWIQVEPYDTARVAFGYAPPKSPEFSVSISSGNVSASCTLP